MSLLLKIPVIISLIFFVCYSYQIIYIPISILKKSKPIRNVTLHRYAVLISARNESVVIGDLLDSIRGQSYPQDLVHVFVIADNCTDNTAEIARAHGATVYTRFNDQLVGKGYALHELLGHIRKDYPGAFDGYFVFDADNILRPDYIERMNEMFSSGYEITTSYRNSKNYGANWISAGYALWFLRESQYLNGARMKIGSSCAVSGTGFLFSNKVMEENDGWPFYLLVEDIQFSNCIIDRSNRGLSIQVRDAGCVRNVSFDHISVRTRRFAESWWGCAEPIAITAVDRSSDNPGGTIENVRFSYIDCEGENGAVIYGLPGRVRDISLDHVRIALNETSRWPKGQYDLRPGEGMQIVAHPAVPLLTHEVEDLRLEQVRLMGTDGDECITAEDLARWSGTISYEILVDAANRVERVFRNGTED